MKVHFRKSSAAEVPLQKSAATTARIACEICAPSISGRSTRYQIAPAPGTPKRPRAARMVIPATKGLPEKSGCSSRDCSGPGSSSGNSATSGGNASAAALTLSTVAPTTTAWPARSLTAQSWILRPSRSTSVSSVNGAIGTGRIRSMVMRAIAIGTGVGIASAAHTTSAAGAEPCCMSGAHGPAASGLVRTRLPSTR